MTFRKLPASKIPLPSSGRPGLSTENLVNRVLLGVVVCVLVGIAKELSAVDDFRRLLCFMLVCLVCLAAFYLLLMELRMRGLVHTSRHYFQSSPFIRPALVLLFLYLVFNYLYLCPQGERQKTSTILGLSCLCTWRGAVRFRHGGYDFLAGACEFGAGFFLLFALSVLADM